MNETASFDINQPQKLTTIILEELHHQQHELLRWL